MATLTLPSNNGIVTPGAVAVAPIKVGMISLGCAKNLVDAEIMLGSVLRTRDANHLRADEADVLVVNTCAFIDSAKEESIEAILEAHQQRGLTGKAGQKLIVSGCMSQRFPRNCASLCRKWMHSSVSIRCASWARSSRRVA